MKVGDMIRIKDFPKDVSEMYRIRDGFTFKVRSINSRGVTVSATVIHDCNSKGKKADILVKTNEFELINNL